MICIKDYTHIGVWGATDTGKTYFLCKYAKKCLPKFIFVNPLMEKKIRGVCNTHVSTIEGLAEALHKKKNKIEFVVDEEPEVAQYQVKQIKELLFRIGNKLDAEDKYWISLLIDECDIIFPKFGKSDSGLLRRGRHYGIHVYLASQRVQLVDHSAINQLRYQVFFRLGSWSRLYYQEYKIPIEEHESWLKRKHHYVLWDDFDMVEYPPIK